MAPAVLSDLSGCATSTPARQRDEFAAIVQQSFSDLLISMVKANSGAGA
jgi:hypothetical protein